MNLRFTFTIALLLSAFQGVEARNPTNTDIDLSDFECRSSIKDINNDLTNIEVLLLYIVSDKCPYSASIKKEIVKYFANQFVTNDSLNLSMEVANVGDVALLTNDQALEIGYVVTQDLIQKKGTNDIVKDAFQTFIREKIVGVALWLVGQSNLENLLPNALTGNKFYGTVRTEVARHFIDRLLAKIK
jgi:hypothetical protein